MLDISSYCLSACNYRLKPATKKAITKTTIPSAPAIKTVTTSKPAPNQQNVVVKRVPNAVVNVSKPSVVPKPVLKFTSGSKVKIKIH